ncbi:MAG TPA: hypothetical protein VMJ34_01660 [Bryobacteraceae bacterium]|nr:hypothetical protein [Bryobacteraceae bacterium]
MEICKYELLSEDELLRRLRQTRLRGFDRAPVYRDATLEIAEMDTESLTPAQRYVLSDGVQSILDVHDAFVARGIDVFALHGAILFWPGESDPATEPPIPFLPPVVEESFEPDGRTVLLINDGIHRVYAARKLGRKINVVLARNVPREYPYYAYALTTGWASVEELEELQEGYQKKEYRNPENYKALFRDFNSVFEGVQKQRKRTNPEHLKA